MNAKEMAAEIKRVGLLRAGNLQDELNAMAIKLEDEVTDLRTKNSALQLSQDNIINALGIKGEGAHSKLVIEYVSGLVAENVAMRGAIEFAEPWLPSCDGELLHIISQAKITPATEAAIVEIREQSVIIGINFVRNMLIDYVEREAGPNRNVPGLIKAAEKCVELSDSLRAGRKG